MKVIAINGSPRKNHNTAILLKKALDGAHENGAETELINLYDLNYKGCTSCFACKRKDGPSYGSCAWKDDLSPVLSKIKEADAIILGSPIYLCDITGQMHAFLERLIFPYVTYTEGYKSLFERKIKTGIIYTMNVTAEQMEERGFRSTLDGIESFIKRAFGHSESLFSYDTYQFDNYEKYVVTVFDEHHKAMVRENQFPKDCLMAYDMGKRFTMQ
ncbi:MAG: flavodoxin family protein [Hungatella sp.]|nr:flavodoxin family protein [Hungatella sp.]